MAVKSINIVESHSKVDSDTVDIVNKLAKQEGRKPTDMARVLIMEAATNRERRAMDFESCSCRKSLKNVEMADEEQGFQVNVE